MITHHPCNRSTFSGANGFPSVWKNVSHETTKAVAVISIFCFKFWAAAETTSIYNVHVQVPVLPTSFLDCIVQTICKSITGFVCKVLLRFLAGMGLFGLIQNFRFSDELYLCPQFRECTILLSNEINTCWLLI